MQAVIWAAGAGTRLQPLTLETPKAMVPINGKPLLQILVEQLKTVDVDEVIVIVKHLKEKIVEFFGDGSKFGIKMIFVEQEELKGNANALLCAEPYVKDRFFCLAVDSLFETELLSRLLEHKSSGVFTCKEVDDPARYGTVDVVDGKVDKIVEKSANPPSNLANFSVYIFPKEIFEACKGIDLSPRGEYEVTDAIQELIDSDVRFEYELSEHIIDIGTHEQFEEAQELGKKLGL